MSDENVRQQCRVFRNVYGEYVVACWRCTSFLLPSLEIANTVAVRHSLLEHAGNSHILVMTESGWERVYAGAR